MPSQRTRMLSLLAPSLQQSKDNTPPSKRYKPKTKKGRRRISLRSCRAENHITTGMKRVCVVCNFKSRAYSSSSSTSSSSPSPYNRRGQSALRKRRDVREKKRKEERNKRMREEERETDVYIGARSEIGKQNATIIKGEIKKARTPTSI